MVNHLERTQRVPSGHPATGSACVQAVAFAPALAGFLAGTTSRTLAIVLGVVVLLWLISFVLLQQHMAAVARRTQVQRDALLAREEAARHLAEHDALTGLGNYRLFWHRLQEEAARARRHASAFSLILFDLDGFKAINDDLGHQAGDEALRHVADALRAALRTEDVVCRQGGDEFAVIAVEAGPREAREMAERLVDAVASATTGTDLGRQLTASAGWACFHPHAESAEELVERCDGGLRAAKQTAGAGHVTGAAEGEGIAGRGERDGRRERALTRLGVIAALARSLAGADDERRVVETALARLQDALDGTRTTIARWNRDAGLLDVAAAHDWSEVPLLPEAGPGPLGALGSAIASGTTVVVKDVRDGGASAPPTSPPGIRSLAVCPIVSGGDVWGALSLESHRPAAFGPEDRALAETAAAEVGRALDRVWAFRCLASEDEHDTESYRLAAAVEDSDEEECWRVADLAWRVGRALGVSMKTMRSLYLGALFHDVGTLGVPRSLLVKPGRLTAEELALVREHPLIAESILRPLPKLRGVAAVVRHEHERYDGSGYPDGLAADRIPLESRVLFASGAFVAMTSPRAYRPALGHHEAVAELRRSSGSQFDPRVTEALLGVIEAAPVPATAGSH